MPLVAHHEKPYWTKYYKRQSNLLGKYGKYMLITLLHFEQ